MTQLTPPYEKVRAHYDLSNDFFALFLGPTMMYTCAYFERDDMTLEEAQIAKIDIALEKCDLHPGARLLDVGCGWGATLVRGVEKFDVRGIGLTLSNEQARYAREHARHLGDRLEFRVQGWEEFDEPVDRIVVICATEHFQERNYAAFFEKCYRLLPPGAPMMIQAIVFAIKHKAIEPTHEDVLFLKFMAKKIFQGGQLRPASVLTRYAQAAGFRVTRQISWPEHYVRTLTCWAQNLEANREQAISLTSLENYEMYLRYLTGCAGYYRSGHLDVVQLSFRKD